MKEALFALLGTLLGGAISLGATWMTGSMTREMTVQAEKRQKLELLTETATSLNQCIFQKYSSAASGSDCDEYTPAYRLLTLSHVYFPELKPEAGSYAHAQLSARLRITKCSMNGDKLATEIERLECTTRLLEEHHAGGELNSLMNKVELVAQTLQ